LGVASQPLETTVLIVEDNAAMRALIRSLVERAGRSVHECDDAETALALYPSLKPDWVLMDIALGGMDGIAASRALLAAHPGARVIIVTEQRDPGYRIAAAHAGASGFVLKEDLLALPALLEQMSGEGPRVPR
jgi:DNA-binding NarL/FixJ family response regulator